MLKTDLHLHTIASGHAQNTFWEYIEQAKKLKMKIIGFADHGPSNEETLVSEVYFFTQTRIPKYIDGIRVLKGIEVNICENGKMDIDDKTLAHLDFVSGNVHPYARYKNSGRAKNTETVIRAIRSGKINILTHPFWTRKFDMDMKKISEEACKNDVLLEVNVHYASKFNEYDFVVPNLKIIVDTIKKRRKKVIIGSDSHNIWELGDDAPIKDVKKIIGLTDDLIINNYPKELFKTLKING